MVAAAAAVADPAAISFAGAAVAGSAVPAAVLPFAAVASDAATATPAETEEWSSTASGCKSRLSRQTMH